MSLFRRFSGCYQEIRLDADMRTSKWWKFYFREVPWRISSILLNISIKISYMSGWFIVFGLIFFPVVILTDYNKKILRSVGLYPTVMYLPTQDTVKAS